MIHPICFLQHKASTWELRLCVCACVHMSECNFDVSSLLFALSLFLCVCMCVCLKIHQACPGFLQRAAAVGSNQPPLPMSEHTNPFVYLSTCCVCVRVCVCVYPLWSPAEGFLPVSSDSKLIWLLDQKYLGESVPDFFPRNHFMWRASRLLPDPVHCFSHDMFPDTFPCVVSAAGRVASSGEMQSPALTTYLRKHSDIRRRK